MMDNSKIDQLTKLIQLLNQLKPGQLSSEQSNFLETLKVIPLDMDSLNTFLGNPELYKNLAEEVETIEALTFEEWQGIIETDEEEEEVEVESIDMGTETTEEPTDPVDSANSDKQAAKKTFSPQNIIYYDVIFVKEEFDIAIKLRKPEEPVPTEIFSFIKTIDEVQHAINELYTDESERIQHLKSLEGIARVGGTSTYIELAKQQLAQYKNEIILQKGSEIKFGYLKELGLAGMGLSSLCLIALLLQTVLDIKYEYGHLISNGIILIIGACIGTWLSFAIRKKEISFEDLRLLSGNKRNPLMRMLVLVLIALCFYFMFITNFLNITLGETFSTTTISNGPNESMAFIIGVFIGMAENTIGPSLTNRIESFTSKL